MINKDIIKSTNNKNNEIINKLETKEDKLSELFSCEENRKIVEKILEDDKFAYGFSESTDEDINYFSSIKEEDL